MKKISLFGVMILLNLSVWGQQEKLNGLVQIEMANSIDNSSPGITVRLNDDFLYDGKYLNNYGFGFHDFRDNSSALNGRNAYLSGFFGIDFFTECKNRLRVNTNGNIGIGTVNPSERLDIVGNLKTKRVALFEWFNSSLGHTNSSVALNGIRQNGVWKLYGDGARSSIGLINMDIFSNIRFISHHDDTYKGGKTMTDKELIDRNTKMIIDAGGNVGIGTNNPIAKFEVNGDIAMSRTYRFKFLEKENGDDRAYIRSSDGENGEAFNSLIFAAGAGIERLFINGNTGKIGIGKNQPEYELDVAGTIRAEEILVEANGQTADFVFSDSYQLRNLSEVENYILIHKHLPDIPSATEMEEQGVNLAEMNKLLLQKVEELTLHLIEKDKELQNVKEDLQKIKQIITSNNIK
ncbi:hypothetical protein JCM21142_104298 [Saccharicrinis fermentans DSM 9555 = JCM 21142]|uniref:Uncharacterized protein n=2 Tax=Saccharicrinis fermentans TaxID=982 RepID=W7YDJ8_9BACT|nr:hypothetical protein JCM21142_104298 [Saccharicrinis fermentans DSM 9555 = JCM 21142]